jgi:hypothetical protein
MAQTRIDTLALRSALQLSPFIFEGKIGEICEYKDPNTGIIYSNNIVHITKTIKGGLQCGTVSVITEGGSYQDQILKVSHTTEFKEGFSGIFVCKLSNSFSPTGCASVSNANPMELIFSEHATIEYFNDLINELAVGYNSKFNDIQDLYNFIEREAGFPILNCDPNFNPTTWKNNNYQQVPSGATTIPVAEPEAVVLNTLVAGGQLSYVIRSVTITGNDPKYLEFDVRVSANDDSTFLDKATFRFKHDAASFGTFPDVVATLDNTFPMTNYTISKTRINDSIYEISVSAFLNTNNRTKIQTTLQTLVHLKIFFYDCSVPYRIRLDSFSNALNGSAFTLSANALSATRNFYTSIVMRDARTGVNCIPEISSIKSVNTGQNIVAGGTKENVVIKGTHFGAYASTSAVAMKNADNGGRTYLFLNRYDIIGWNDTTITLTVPSIVDSVKLDTATGIYEAATLDQDLY